MLKNFYFKTSLKMYLLNQSKILNFDKPSAFIELLQHFNFKQK